MHKVFISGSGEKVKVLVITDSYIYTGKTKQKIIDKDILDTEQSLNTEGLFSIPFNYFYAVSWHVDTPYIVIHSKGAKEHFSVDNMEQAQEILKYFKFVFPGKKYYIDHPSFIKRARPPLIAIAVIGVIFASSLVLSFNFEAINERTPTLHNSVLNLLYALSSMGPLKLTIVTLCVLLIPIARLIYLQKNPRVIHWVV